MTLVTLVACKPAPDTTDSGETGVTPTSLPAAAPGLYWSEKDSGRIQHWDPQTGTVSLILAGMLDPRGLVVTPNHITLIDAGTNVLLRSSMDGAQTETLTTTAGPGDLQLEGQDLVFSDREAGTIRRLTPDGTLTDIVTGVFEPYFIDIANDTLWWADFNSPDLHSNPLPDGPPQLWTLDAIRLRDLVIAEDYVTWCDREAGKIQRAPLNGLNPTEDLFTGLATPHGLIRVGDDLYWTDTTTGEVRTGPADGGTSTLIAEGLGGPWALTWFDGR